jgi:hypothetical protein
VVLQLDQVVVVLAQQSVCTTLQNLVHPHLSLLVLAVVRRLLEDQVVSPLPAQVV